MIIAEIGLNHLGYEVFLSEYIKHLLHADVDAITLQIREPSYYKEKKHLKLDNDIYIRAISKVHAEGKKFGIAIGDLSYIDFFESIDVDFYKVIRNDITNIVLIDKLKTTNKLVFVSTGLSSEDDITQFIQYIGNASNFKLNHTQLSYNVEDCNLSAIERMRSKYGLDVSFGSHCSNHNVLYMSLVYNPSDILFYVKLDRTGLTAFPDDKHAISIKNVAEVVQNLKALPSVIGSGIKQQMDNKLRMG